MPQVIPDYDYVQVKVSSGKMCGWGEVGHLIITTVGALKVVVTV